MTDTVKSVEEAIAYETVALRHARKKVMEWMTEVRKHARKLRELKTRLEDMTGEK